MSFLRISFHGGTGRPVVEVFDENERLLGIIYPTEENSIHIVSKHFAPDDELFQPSHGILATPGYVLKFKSP